MQATSNSCVFLYWQRYCSALQQRASAKLCGVEERVAITLGEFQRVSLLGSVHILVIYNLKNGRVHNAVQQKEGTSYIC